MLSLAFIPLFVASALAGLAVEPLPSYTHEQNTATGEYGYSYHGGPSAKTEFRAPDGTTTGTYSYVDANGILQTTNYIADEFGFRVAGSNIPVDGAVPLDAPDVAAEKAAHLAEHNRATLAALSHQRKKRGILAAPVVAPIAHYTTYTALPVATSHQSRIDIHHAAPAYIASPLHSTLLFRKKRGILAGAYAAPLPVTYASSVALPFSTSSQSRFQVHNTAKIIEEIHTPVVAPVAAPIVAKAALPVAAPIVAKAAVPVAAPIYQTLPLATSSQSRFQVHNGAKIIQEVHQPIYAPAAPVYGAAPALPAFGLPAGATYSDDSISIESA